MTPGCSRGTMNDLIAARPSDLSSVAQTTMWVARDPAVTKIFSPLMTYSSPSSFAVVVTAAESEPKPGSVMAIAAHTSLPSRSSCSSVATPEIAALPRPWRGTDSIKATSPQLTSITLRTADMLPPLWLASLASAPSRNASAPAKAMALACRDALEERGQRVELDRILVLPQIPLARDRSQHLGGALMRLLDHRFELLRQFQIDCHDSTFGYKE